jgi:hypothetical protein
MATMKFRNLGIIRIKTPAIRATIGEICAAVMVIENSNGMKGERIEDGNLTAGADGG